MYAEELGTFRQYAGRHSRRMQRQQHRKRCHLLDINFNGSDLLPPPAPAHGLTLETVYYRRGWEGAYDHPLHGSELCEAEGGGVDEACVVACSLDEECALD